MIWSEHKYPLGQVCELELSGESNLGIEYDLDGKEVCLNITGRARLIVVGHTHDCDGSPLYALSDQPIAFSRGVRGSIAKTFKYRQHCKFLTTNHHEDLLTPIENQFVPIKFDSIDDFVEDIWGRPLRDYSLEPRL